MLVQPHWYVLRKDENGGVKNALIVK